MGKAPDWAGAGGDTWARHWRDTDRALAPVGAALDSAILAAAPASPFRALDVGCGPGTTALALSARRPDAAILGCDLSAPLIAIARERAAAGTDVRFIVEDARAVAPRQGPFDLLFSRHGVMFFDDPGAAFADLRDGAADGAALVFSCFRSWAANAWAAELCEAAAGAPVAAPGREPGGFAFADKDHVAELLAGAGWSDARPTALDFDYVAGEGPDALGQARAFLTELGPAARSIEALAPEDREAAVRRLHQAIERRCDGGRVVFPAAAWIWTAAAG